MGVEETSPTEIPLVRRLIARSSSIPSSSAFFDGVALPAASFPFRKILRGWALPALEHRPDNEGAPCTPPTLAPGSQGWRKDRQTPKPRSPEGVFVSFLAPRRHLLRSHPEGSGTSSFLVCAEGTRGGNQQLLSRALKSGWPDRARKGFFRCRRIFTSAPSCGMLPPTTCWDCSGSTERSPRRR